MSVGDYIHKSVVKYSVMGLMLTNDATVFVVVVFLRLIVWYLSLCAEDLKLKGQSV